MRFVFCGDLDCPDWLLSEINTLSKLSSLKVKLLCNQVVKSILGEEVERDKVMKLTTDAKLDEEDTKAVIAALNQILTSAVRHGVQPTVLSNELQQLGLPKEHSSMICKCYDTHHDSLHHHSIHQTISLPSIHSLTWRLDHVIASSSAEDLNKPIIRLKMSLKEAGCEKAQNENFSLSVDKFEILLAELQRARKEMQDLESY